jgi:hypothetical protein
MLKEVGITIDIIPVEYVTYVALYEHGENGMEDYPITYNHMGGWPPEEIGSWMHGKPEGGMNMGFYDNPEVDALLDEGYVTMDAAKRKEIYDEVQAINAVELPFIHLYSTEGAVVYNADFMNMESTRAVTSWKAYDDVWWIHGELPAEPEPEPEPEPPISGDVEARVKSLESSSQSLSSEISSLKNQVSSLSTEISELKDQPAATANNTMSYLAILIALVAIGAAYYFGTQK